MSNPLVSEDRTRRAAESRVGDPRLTKTWLITGAGGQLGRDLAELLGKDPFARVHAYKHLELDVSNENDVRRCVQETEPDVLVNCAAYHNLAQCEEHPDRAEQVNAAGPLNLALADPDTLTKSMHIVHFSTNYVFDGSASRPYAEDDFADPQSEYAKSKLLGEKLLLRYAAKALVVRTCGLYGAGGNASKGGNFVERVLARLRAGEEVAMVDDQLVQPTHTRDLAERVIAAVGLGVTGTLHLVAEGSCSWHDFAQAAANQAGVWNGAVTRSSTHPEDPIGRPLNGLLATNRARELGLTMPHWSTQLEDYVDWAQP